MIEGIDRYFIQFRNDPKLAESDRSTWNPGWFGFGPIGEAIVLLHKEIAPELTCPVFPLTVRSPAVAVRV